MKQEERPAETLPQILVATPLTADANVIIEALGEAGIDARRIGDHEPLAVAGETAGCLLVPQEGLTPAFSQAIADFLANQPPWSELPVLILVGEQADPFVVRDQLFSDWRSHKITVLTRPISPVTLLTATQSALRARLRQFRLRDQLEREQELRRELNHRVKNILSTVQAMARMTQRLGGSDGSRFNDFEARLGALSTVHAMLQDDRGEPATLRHVVSELIAPYANGEEGRVSVSAPTRPLDPEAAKTLALCLHELATNSAKYGAFSTEAGHVDIRLARDGEGWAFSWTESGGPPVTPPQRQGYGTRYLNGALQSLFGHSPDFDYAADGFRLRVGGAQPVLFAD